MAQSKQISPTETTESNPDTYNSSSIARFAWEQTLMGEHGILHVEFQSGGQYIYLGVPQRLAEELKMRAYEPEKFSDSLGQFFYKNVRNQFERKGQDYAKLSSL